MSRDPAKKETVNDEEEMERRRKTEKRKRQLEAEREKEKRKKKMMMEREEDDSHLYSLPLSLFHPLVSPSLMMHPLLHFCSSALLLSLLPSLNPPPLLPSMS